MNKIAESWLEKYNWTHQTRLVIGVSGGVDSMVLLSILLSLPKKERPRITVAHINHQLRRESDAEEVFVRVFCAEHGVGFTGVKWHDGPNLTHSVEALAREFRYNFFEKVMRETKSTVLLTAHHQGDHVETILMRLIQGSQLESLGGIIETREFGDGLLIRPLLHLNKQNLYALAKTYDIPFMEDVTNQQTTYFRNRIRHTILPLLEEENPQFSDGLSRLSKEALCQKEALDELMRPVYQTCVKESDEEWLIDLNEFYQLSPALQSQLNDLVCQVFHHKTGVLIGYLKKELLLSTMKNLASFKQIDLGQEWVGEKNYQKFKIMKKEVFPLLHTPIFLTVNQGDYLSETEWIGLFDERSMIIPEFDDTWIEEKIEYQHTKNHRIQIRKREDGDKFVYNQQGQTKKVSRFFIDEKIPVKKRQESWIVLDEKSNVLWVLPFRKSYLSIPRETDKIQYKLVYFKKKDE